MKKIGKSLNKPGPKVYTEEETRNRLINVAKYWGFENELRQIFARTDMLLLRCTNEQERKQIAVFGALEIHKLLGAEGTLEIDGKKVV